MEECSFFLVTPHDGTKWLADELHDRSFTRRVRELLGGRWERESQYQPMIKAFFGRNNRRVLVIGFPGNFDRTKAEAAVKKIIEGREDLS